MYEKLLSLALEIGVTLFLAGLFYLWQRHRILFGPRNWREHKLLAVHQLALACQRPEDFADLIPFLEATEKLLSSDTPWMERRYLEQWGEAQLPEDILGLLAECLEWLDYSQPKT